MTPAPASPVRLTFDGTTITATAGQTVAAALLGAGIRSWRTTRRERRPRGLFCGIGVCYDCLLTVDGVANQRACVVPVREGMRLSSVQPPLPTSTETRDSGAEIDVKGRNADDAG